MLNNAMRRKSALSRLWGILQDKQHNAFQKIKCKKEKNKGMLVTYIVKDLVDIATDLNVEILFG